MRRSYRGVTFHTIALCHHFNCIHYQHQPKDLSQVTDERVLDLQNFAYRYFTSWNLTIQTIYFTLALLDDILILLSTNEKFQQDLLKWKGYIFTALVFPCSMFVSLMFWAVYSINREFVLPEVLDEFVPGWLNHSVHTNIVILLFVELLLVRQPIPSFKSALNALTLITLVYNFVFFFTYYESGKWLYGLFYRLKLYEIILLTILNYILSVGFLKLGIVLQNYRHRITKETCKSKLKKIGKDLLHSN